MSNERWVECLRKQRYPTAKRALEVAASRPVPLALYVCRFCGCWHLTSHPKPTAPEDIKPATEAEKRKRRGESWTRAGQRWAEKQAKHG